MTGKVVSNPVQHPTGRHASINQVLYDFSRVRRLRFWRGQPKERYEITSQHVSTNIG